MIASLLFVPCNYAIGAWMRSTIVLEMLLISNYGYRFSAFWLRSKCSICSYQFNIWYDPHVGSTILIWFLETGEVLGACSTFTTDQPGIAVLPGMVHLPSVGYYNLYIAELTIQWYKNCIHMSNDVLMVRISCLYDTPGVGIVLMIGIQWLNESIFNGCSQDITRNLFCKVNQFYPERNAATYDAFGSQLRNHLNSGFPSERINLSPFTKDFRGGEQL